MTEIILTATQWRCEDDFYDAFFKAVDAPQWHGRNLNALEDSIFEGDINGINLPYVIRVQGFSHLPESLKNFIYKINDLILDGKSEGYQVSMVLEP